MFAVMHAPMFDERFDLGFEVAGQKMLLRQDAVFHGLVPALDLALGLRMERCATILIFISASYCLSCLGGCLLQPLTRTALSAERASWFLTVTTINPKHSPILQQ